MKNKFNHSILLLSVFSIILLCIRIVKTSELSFIFMVWNLFLGFVPFWISQYLYKQKQLHKSAFFLIGFVWLLFLPNAPYMLTDLFHLHPKSYLPIWFDLVLILSFAITGLVLFYQSILQIIQVVKFHCPSLHHPLYLIVLFLAVSYGVYIGRFLRVNSWDVLNPIALAETCIKPLFNSAQLKDVTCFTLVFSVFLSFIYLVVKPVFKSNHQ
jgi:uncharacterized membrane protein